MQPQPLIAVHDVSTSRSWYENVLGLRGVHGGDEYERMMCGDVLVLQLHQYGAHDHSNLGEPSESKRGGAILWFQTDLFDDTVSKIQAERVSVLEGPRVNPNANHREIWLRDPDGYTVVIAGQPGDV